MLQNQTLGLLGKKVGMTRVFQEDGSSFGVTVVELGPCVVLQKRVLKDKEGKGDGYIALQLGFGAKSEKHVNKAEAGHAKKAGGVDKARRFIREFRVSQEVSDKFELGQEVTLGDIEWKDGDFLDITGTSKGRGFAGVMKRHNFAGFRATHGTHEYFRHGGSIGCRKWPGRVFKGQKMPGHMGNKRVTVQNVKVVSIRPEDNVVLVHGSVPGPRNGYVALRLATKKHAIKKRAA